MLNKAGARLMLVGLGFFSSLFVTAQAPKTPTSGSSSKKEKQAERQERINEMIRQEEEGALIYHKQTLLGLKLYSDGWAGVIERGYMKTVNKTNLFSIELGERKDQKEEKVAKATGGGFFLGNPLIYGKRYNMMFVKLGVGQSYLIGGKGNKNGVALSAVYNGGISLGLLKPYYLNVSDPLSGQTMDIKYQDDGSRNDSLFIDPAAINGGVGFFKGANELKLKPGLFLKGALRFDYGRYNELISALEAGFNAEYYFSDVPIMVNNDPKKFFLNVFIALEIGRRK
jgi:hypothetical protein